MGASGYKMDGPRRTARAVEMATETRVAPCPSQVWSQVNANDVPGQAMDPTPEGRAPTDRAIAGLDSVAYVRACPGLARTVRLGRFFSSSITSLSTRAPGLFVLA